MRPSDEELEELASSVSLKLVEGDAISLEGAYAYKIPISLPCKVYILDCIEGREVASKPELVGEEFLKANYNAALKAAKLVVDLLDPDTPKLLLHILRGSPGYRLHDALRSIGVDYREIWVRPRYLIGGFRDHRERRIEVVYESYRDLQGLENVECDLIVADTIATGTTLSASLSRVLGKLRSLGLTVKDTVVYGFMSLEGIRNSLDAMDRLGQRVFIALEDVTALAENMYDMPLYGVDETTYARRRVLRSIGGITVLEAFRGMVASYAPGMDQPGDWSERQPLLYTGEDNEKGDIKGHLKRSLETLRRLRPLTRRAEWYREWMDEIFSAREKAITEAITRINT